MPFIPARCATVAATLTILTIALAAPAGAAGHRARLSADLADQLAAGSASIDLIVHGTRAEVDALAKRYNVQVKRYLKSGAVLRVTAGQLDALQRDETLEHLSADVPIRSIADVTAQTIGADQVWAGDDGVASLSGAGVGVAVIDSGVDQKHAALKGKVVYSKDFIGGNGLDLYGHGTHVAGIIAGSRGRTSDTDDYQGIAAGAEIISLRVLDENGAGMASDVIEAIDWAIENRKQFDIKVINLSLGAPVTQPYRDDPMCEAVERAVAAGIVVVAAAGNYGTDAEGRQVYGSVATPGNDPSVITVGALDTHDTAIRSDDTIAKFSSKGPTRYDLVLKPDLVAPGTHVVSAESAGSYLSRTYTTRHVAGSGTNAYMQLSGTSMAAGVVSGTVALLFEAREHLTPRDTKAVLQMTSSFMPGAGLVASGAGSLNALAAVAFVDSKGVLSLPNTTISGESVSASGLAFAPYGEGELRAQFGRLSSRRGPRAAFTGIGVWSAHDTIIWGTSRPSALNGPDTIIWGTSAVDTIIWGTNAGDTIIWGTNTADTIIWGTSATDTIIWGTNAGDTIIWGTNATDTIVWGTTTADTIIWGTILGEGELE